LPPRFITSWPLLKQKFLVNFQGFQAYPSTEEDFFSCQQYERETLSDFFRMFLRLKAQALEVSDEQAITQAIKVLRKGQLHSHLVRECPRMLEELYNNFWKFSRAEMLHFHNLGQQKKLQMRTKAQGQPGTTKVERAHRVLTPRTSKSTTSTQMNVEYQKIGRKISELRD
jgi:hypothetical protein